MSEEQGPALLNPKILETCSVLASPLLSPL